MRYIFDSSTRNSPNRVALCLTLVAVALLALSGCGKSGQDSAVGNGSELNAKDIEVNNRGVALMGYFDYSAAREAFREAVDRQPLWVDAKINLAIATLNRQLDGDEELARSYLAEVLEEAPDSLRAHFVAGLLSERAGEADKAKLHYQTVLKQDPQDAYAAYYLAVLTQTDDAAAALELFERAIELDPYLRSAYYGAFLLNVRSGNKDAGLKLQSIYERLADNPRARLAETKYTRMGPKADALAVGIDEPVAATLPTGPVFLDPQVLVTFDDTRDRAMTTVDLNHNGLQDLFVTSTSGVPDVILAGEDEYRLLENHELSALGRVSSVAWADIDNDGLVDVAACGSKAVVLRFQTDIDVWASTRRLTSLAANKTCTDLQLLDADHDGDLDLFVAFAEGGHDVLSNNGDRTFRSLRQERSLGFSTARGLNLLATDLDSDRDTDLLVVNEAGVDILFNDRLWDYTPASEKSEQAVPASLLTSNLKALTAADANADGRVELYGVSGAGQLVRWSRDGANSWSDRVLMSMPSPGPGNVTLDVSDFNGDGRPDLLLADGSSMKVLAIKEEGVSTMFEYEGQVTSAIHFVADADRGPSVLALVSTPQGQQLLRFPPGPGRGKFAALMLQGKEDKADSMRSNRSGVGTRVAARRGSFWSITDTFDQNTGRGQSSQPLSVGLGTDESFDYIAIDWSDGVFQTELDLAAGKLHSVTETQRQLSSCPVLFAWDGDEWSFVSDVLGVGGIGFLHDPAATGAARYGVPRPWEYFLLPQEALQPVNGQLKLKVTEPMEELALLDKVQLVAYDLAPGWKMVLDERMATGAPQVTGSTRFYKRELMPSRVMGNNGVNLTASVAHADFVAADLGKAHPRFLGMLQTTQTITMEFDQPLDTVSQSLLLKATGWVEYPYSQTVFAAWQAGAHYVPPSLEAGDNLGNWTMIHKAFGYPAGMPREMSVPLGALPTGTTRLRLSGNLEIYWDKLSVVEVGQPTAADIHRQPLHIMKAELGQMGFPERIDQPQKRPDYDYSKRVPFWDARYPKGNYTGLGDVEPLLQLTDGAFVTLGPGEDVEIAFNEPAPVREGWTRRYVFFVSGYAKDMDMFTQDSGTVGPLPQLPSANESLHKKYNTRYRDSH